MITEDAKTWPVVATPDPRQASYGAIPEQRRTLRHRARFRSQLQRDPATGCWLWRGYRDRDGRPVFRVRTASHGNNSSRSAFVWMMEQWFPQVPFPNRDRATRPVCGRGACLSPHHRQQRTYAHLTKLTPGQVAQIFAARGYERVGQVAARHGVAESTVLNVWAGRSHRDLTGLKVPTSAAVRLTPEMALSIWGCKDTGRTQREVAEEFSVSQATVSNIWRGRTWADLTGARLSASQSA